MFFEIIFVLSTTEIDNDIKIISLSRSSVKISRRELVDASDLKKSNRYREISIREITRDGSNATSVV